MSTNIRQCHFYSGVLLYRCGYERVQSKSEEFPFGGLEKKNKKLSVSHEAGMVELIQTLDGNMHATQR